MKYQKKKIIPIINIVFLVALGINAGMAYSSKLDFESGSDNFLEGAYFTEPPSGPLSKPEVPDKWKEVIVLEEFEDGTKKVEYLNYLDMKVTKILNPQQASMITLKQ